MDLAIPLHAFIPSVNSVAVLVTYFLYLAIAGSILPGKVVNGVVLQDGTRLHYRCNGLLLLVLLVALLGIGAQMDFISPTVISDRGLELLSTTLMFCFLVSDVVSSLVPGKF
ncbi:delta(14)-sterol reductase-like, partial [Pistacia vera]|uniref:delta(14)-sterol reductase-like n=1 Tax=Pistacia vera TaxID=55513 RepID=UPI001263A27F